LGQPLSLGVARAGQAIERRPARKPEAEHPRRLVESLARGVVARPADHLEAPVLRRADEVGVGAANHEAEERRLQVRAREHRGVDVTPKVVDAGHRFGPGGGQALSYTDTHQEATDEARSSGY